MRFGRLSVYLSSITLLQILISFGMQLYVVSIFGVGVQSDALYAGQTLHTVFKVLLPDTLALVLVPLLASKAEDELREMGWSLFVGTGAFFLVLSGLLCLLAPLFTMIFVPGFAAPAKQLTTSLMRIQIFGLAGCGWTAVLTAQYHVRNQFLYPATCVLVGGLVGWGWLLLALSRNMNIEAAAWAQVVAFSSPMLFMVGTLGPFRGVSWRSELFRDVWQRVRPLLLGKGYGIALSPFDRILGSYLPSGSIVILTLVSRFYGAAQRTFIQGVLTPFLPQLSRSAHEGNWHEFQTVSKKQVQLMVAIGFMALIAVATGSLLSLHLFPPQPVRLVAGRISSADLAKIWTLMFWSCGALLGGCLGNAITNSFFAQGDTKTPTKVAMGGLTAGIMVKATGCYIGGINGMAIADTVTALSACTVLGLLLRKRLKRFIAAGEEVFTVKADSVSAGV